MAHRTLNRLTVRQIQTVKKPGRYGDGGGLYLVVTAAGGRKWVFRYTTAAGQRDMGLGAAAHVSLAEARQAASDARACLRGGRDPVSERALQRKQANGTPTFGEVADDVVASIEHGFRNEKHKEQWRMTLGVYAAPLRTKPIDQITTEDVLAVLKPLWQSKAETASRLRGRIERVMDAARARGFRSGENPARWRGHLDAILPRRAKLTRGHHAALPFDDLSEFVGKLREAAGISARALEFVILTAARSGEVMGMTWGEVDLVAKVWMVPAERMKAGRAHRVPLSPAAVTLLRAMRPGEPSALVFPGGRIGQPLSATALSGTLDRVRPGFTVHGFRSTFRDWAGECTHFAREIAEAALAHVVGDATERAYRRGDALEKRRELMDAWAQFCEPKAYNVVALRAPRQTQIG